MKPFCHVDPSGHNRDSSVTVNVRLINALLCSLKFETDKCVNKDIRILNNWVRIFVRSEHWDKCLGWTKRRKLFSPIDSKEQNFFTLHRDHQLNLKCILCVQMHRKKPCADLDNYTRGSLLICYYLDLFHRACFGQERTKLCIPIQNLTYGSQR